MSTTPLHTHTHTASSTERSVRKLRRLIPSKRCIVNWSGGLVWLGVGIFFPCPCFMCRCYKVLEPGVFIFCSAKPLGQGWTLGAGGQAGVFLHWHWSPQRRQSCLLRLVREFRTSLTMQQKHNSLCFKHWLIWRAELSLEQLSRV